jgi:histidyl-tRNA synthetase
MKEIQLLKGTKDFLPEEQAIRNEIKEISESVFRNYGCKPLETSILNPFELMASKYGGGAEILKEVYRLTDQGERDISLRYDLTIPFAKVIAQNPELRMPFKRYEIGKVFRDGPVKTGRLREFTQCDVDIVGVKNMLAEAELMTMAVDIFTKLGLEIEIQYNNRKLLVGMLRSLEIPEGKTNAVIVTLDKVEKIGVDGVAEELNEKGINTLQITRIVELLKDKDLLSLDKWKAMFQNSLYNEGLNEIAELEAYLEASNIKEFCRFTPFLARGLDIYTGTIYEIFLKNSTITSSIGSGGRYDKIIGKLLNSEREYPTVGISIGLDVVYYALKENGISLTTNSTELLIIPIGMEKEVLTIAQGLRKTGVKVEIEMMGKKLAKAFSYANKEKIPYVMVVGSNEVETSIANIREMDSGKEISIDLNKLDEIYALVKGECRK